MADTLTTEIANGDSSNNRAKPIGKTVAVGMPVTRHPPHRSVRAEFPHTALILDE